MSTKPVKPFNKFQIGLGFAIVMTISYMIIDLIKVDKITTQIFLTSLLKSIIGGAIAGFLYAWVMGMYFKSQNKKRELSKK